MSGKPEGQVRKESGEIMGDNQIDAKQVKLCSLCHIKPTISDSSDICAFCMGKKGNEKRRLGKAAGNEEKPDKTKEAKHQAEKTDPRPSQAVTIDFSKYPLILKQVEELANGEIRPLDLQIIYLLKHHLDAIRGHSKAA